ncbi:MAG: pyrophosphatase PpaX [Clostridiales bacterium]|nr:pyrophosphatase PpaX [Clostridiales bacterium]
MNKLMIFDFDGTLMDTNSVIIDSLNAAVHASLDRYLTDEELQTILGRPLREQMGMVSETHCDAMVAFYRQYYRAHQEGRVFPFEGVLQMLKALKAESVTCAILTNKGRNGLTKGLETHGMTDFFTYSLCADDIERTKPDPYGILKIASELSFDLKDVFMIGDSAHDIEAGKNAGVTTVLVGWSILKMEVLKALEPDYIINHPLDLLKRIM